MAPTTTKAWVVRGQANGFDELSFQPSHPLPALGDGDVLVRLRAAALNYRDLIIPRGHYPFPLALPVVGASDGAGDVVAVGAKVTRWRPGDRVVTLFNQGHQFGAVDVPASQTGLGGVLDGTLREHGVFAETGLVRQPANLSATEAAGLTCAGLTAWNALYGLRPLKLGDWVLVQGTGGVSLFALQFAVAAGATVIATTSSADKVERLKRLGARHVLNYREDADWGATAKKLTPGGDGVDHVIEVGGADSLAHSLKAVKFEGVISIIGFLGGARPKESLLEALNHLCTVRGVYVGSRAQMEDMVRAVEAGDIHPVVDKKAWKLDEAREAYAYMWNKRHVGKVTITID